MTKVPMGPGLPTALPPDFLRVGPLTIQFVVAFRVRLILFTTLSLAIGFCLGWSLHPAHPATPPGSFKDQPPQAQTTARAISSATSQSAAPALKTTEPGAPLRNRVETLRWLRQSGAPIRFPVFATDSLNSALGRVLELTPEEMTRLDNAARETRRELNAARLALATSKTSEDGKTLVVEVPAIDPSASRALYERLLGTFTTTLGPDRYEVFNELTGDSFESGFEQFGLNTMRYELGLEPRFPSPDAPAQFEYKRYFLDPTGVSKGWTGTTATLAQLDRSEPILTHFFPSSLRMSAGK